MRPGALGVAEREREPALVARVELGHVALDAVDRLQLRLRLARLGRLVAKALDEALHPRDLGLAAGDVAPGGELARRLLGAPGVPRALEVARAAGLELEHRGADRLEKPAVVGDEDDRRVEPDEVVLEPLERLDVEVVGRLVEQQQVGARGEHPRERGPGQLTAREAAERAVELVVAEAEPAQGRLDAVAPAIAAGGLQPRLGVGVGVQRRLVGAVGHPLPRGARGRPRSPRSSRARSVTYSRSVAPARGGRWSCKRDAHALAGRERAGVDPGLARRASAAASSCRCRCARTASCARHGRA